MVESFILRWGYVAVGIGTFAEGEAILIAGGALAHKGLLSLPLVIGAAFLGSVAGDQLWFHAGKRFGRRLIERRPQWREKVARAEAWVSRRELLFVLGFRFIYGIRTLTPIILGATGYSGRRFAVLNVLGGAAWAVAFGGAGWALGASLEAILKRAARVEELVVAVAVLAIILWLLSRMVRRRRPQP